MSRRPRALLLQSSQTVRQFFVDTHPPPSTAQVLSADWDKYSDWMVFSGGVDRCVKAWDLRRPDVAVMTMHGHG